MSAPPSRLPRSLSEWARPHDPDWSLPASRLVAFIRSATLARLGFCFIISIAALAVAPITWLAMWLIAITVWELGIRPALEETFVLTIGDVPQSISRLSAIHLVGGIIYVAFPFLAWSTAEPIGMLIATVWVCATANHAFVYFGANRTLLFSSIAPLTVAAIAAPLVADQGQLTLAGCIGSLALVGLIFTSALFGHDRRTLLKTLSTEATARDEAETANAAKSRFLATVSHELRTPLNAIIGYAEMIGESEPGGDIAHDAANIQSAARGLLEQINTILDVSRLQAGDMALKRSRYDLTELLHDAGSAAQKAVEANRNQLRIDVDGLGVGLIDAAQLNRCVGRLLSNAAKFTNDGEVRLSATRGVVAGQDTLTVVIEDTGIGIPKDHLTKIFDPLFQIDSSDARQFEGTGLGLAHARLAARLMGGDVVCSSVLGVGSTFTATVRVD